MRDTRDLIATSRLRRSRPDPAVARTLRERADLSQSEVGKEIGVTAATISRWESGARSPTSCRLDAYAELLAALATELVQ